MGAAASDLLDVSINRRTNGIESRSFIDARASAEGLATIGFTDLSPRLVPPKPHYAGWISVIWAPRRSRSCLICLGVGLTLVGTVSQHFVWLAHWRLRPASGSGTKASRAVQGDRPT